MTRPSSAAPERPRLSARVVPRGALTAADERALLALLGESFDGVDARVFRADLDGKDDVLLLYEPDGALCGFSTLASTELELAGERVRVVFSGDTIVRRAAWGSPALARSWIDAVARLHELDGPRRVFWLLITSGYRTYRFLPVFWRRFWPRHDAPTPAYERALTRAAAERRFGRLYDPAAGVVRLERPQVLRGELLDIPPGKRRDPHVAFFAAANPGYVRGDELVCLTELSRGNLTPAGKRVMLGARRRRRRGDSAA